MMKNTVKFQDLIRGDKPVLVDFYAPWCGPCKMMQPILQDLVSTIGDQVKIIKIDVEKNPNIARSLRIQGVPTLVLFQSGAILWRQSGVVQAHQLAAIIDRHIKKEHVHP